MPYNGKNRGGEQTAGFEVRGLANKAYAQHWAVISRDPRLRDIVWKRFWELMGSSGDSALDSSLFEFPGSNGESSKTVRPTPQTIGQAWQQTELESLFISTSWTQAVLAYHSEIDRRRGLQNNYSDADSIEREEVMRKWAPPLLFLEPKDNGIELVLSNGAWAIGSAAGDAAAAAGKAVGAVAKQGGKVVGAAIGGAVSGVASSGAAGVAGVVGALAVGAIGVGLVLK